MRMLTSFLLFLGLPASAEEPPPPSKTTTVTTTTTTTDEASSPDPSPSPAEEPEVVLPVTPLVAALEAVDEGTVELPATGLSAVDRVALAQVLVDLEAASEQARVHLDEAAALVKLRRSERTTARLQVRTARLNARAARTALKAHDADPDAGSAASVQGARTRAGEELVAARHARGVAVGRLGVAKATFTHHQALGSQQDARIDETRARLDGADDRAVGKLERRRHGADAREARTRIWLSNAEIDLESAEE